MPCTFAQSKATPARQFISSLSLRGVVMITSLFFLLQQSSGNKRVHADYNAHDGRVVPVHPSVDTVAPSKEC
eukprot:7765209-Pyramimonas_sp.AAC.1